MTRNVPHKQDVRRRHRPTIVDVTKAACRTADPDLFFHPEGERGPDRRNRDAAAKAVCGQCQVWHDCQEEAFRNREEWGVWGGLTADERNTAWRAHAVEREQVAS